MCICGAIFRSAKCWGGSPLPGPEEGNAGGGHHFRWKLCWKCDAHSGPPVSHARRDRTTTRARPILRISLAGTAFGPEWRRIWRCSAHCAVAKVKSWSRRAPVGASRRNFCIPSSNDCDIFRELGEQRGAGGNAKCWGGSPFAGGKMLNAWGGPDTHGGGGFKMTLV